jgi:hypothetical protein
MRSCYCSSSKTLETEVEVGTDGALETEGNVTPTVAAVIALCVVVRHFDIT